MGFHDATNSLLGSESRTSEASRRAVEQVETRLQLRLPASVREWYLRDDAIQVLADCSNCDCPAPLEEFEIVEAQSLRLVPFKHESQGVCRWAFALTETDDPPVLVELESDEEFWGEAAPTFSRYVYSCVWDYRLVFGRSLVVQAQNQALSSGTLDRLGKRFSAGPSSGGWPGDVQHRFTGRQAAVLIWSSADQADWFIASNDTESLQSILMEVWDWDEVGKSLYGNKAAEEETIDAVRNSR